MRIKTTRRFAVLATAGTLAVALAVPAASDAMASEGAPAAAASSVVPLAGSGTAFGYSALIRHESGPEDNQGTLVLLAPDGRSKTIGAVSDRAYVADVSSNARTVVTAFRNHDTDELRLTLWDTESGRPTYLRVAGGGNIALVKDGIVVTRYNRPTLRFSRGGTLLGTYSWTGDQALVASADGTRVLQGSSDGRVVIRDVANGSVTRRVAVPAGRDRCWPAYQLDATSFSMGCNDPYEGAPGESTAYRAPFSGSAPASRLVPAERRSGDVRSLSGGALVYNAAAGTPASQPTLRDASGVSSPLDGFPGVKEGSNVIGAYGSTVFLASTESFDSDPAFTLQRVDVVSGAVRTVAGPGSALRGLVTSAKTVDGT